MQQTARSIWFTRSGLLGYVSLFTSFGTLLCCALPSLFVLVGLGATVASFLSAFPWLVTMSHHKELVFVVSGVLIASNLLYVYVIAPRLQVRRGVCPIDSPGACIPVSRTSRTILWISAAVYCCGVFTAYLLGPMLMRWG